MNKNSQADLELFLGQNTCLALWKCRPESVQCIYILQRAFAETAEGVALIVDAVSRGIQVEVPASPSALESMQELGPTEREVLRWQSVAMLAPRLRAVYFEPWSSGNPYLQQTPSLLPFLDGVGVPINVANFARSCAHFGVPAILGDNGRLPDRNSQFGRLSGGASEEIELVSGTDITSTLRTLKQLSYEVVTFSSHATRPLYDFAFPPKTVFILGAERDGVSQEALAASDVALSLPNLSSTVDSLNVATMGAIALFEFHRQHAGARRHQ